MTFCIFCDIINENLPSNKIYEDGVCVAILDIQPINKGHVLVIPKIHREKITEYSDDVISHLFVIATKINRAIRKSALKCEAINYFLADGEAAGQEVFHTHIHVIPRFQDDGFGLKFPDSYHVKPERSELEQIAKMINLS